MKMKTSAKIAVGVCIAAAVFVSFRFYKKKKSDKQSEVAIESKVVVSSALITDEQTKKLQQKLNEFIYGDGNGKFGSTITTSAVKVAFALTDLRTNAGGLIAVSGRYDNHTKTAVKALQTYLNTVRNLNLQENGVYDKDTDKATGWKILN